MMQQLRIYPWVVWGLAAAFFFFEYFARVSPSVMVPALMQDFHVNAFQLGNLSAFFYYAYVSMQLPVGLLFDRYGVRRLLASMAALSVVGLICFASAKAVHQAEIGRFLLGFSSAFAFVGALKLATDWFPASQFGLLAGLSQALGMLGAAAGEAPMAWLVARLGWRSATLVFVVIFLLLAAAIYGLVRDKPSDIKAQEAQALDFSLARSLSLWQSLMMVFRRPRNWINALYSGLLYAPTAVLGELWGVEFIVRTYGIEKSVAASAISFIFLGWGVGGPVVGWLSDRVGRRIPVMALSALGSLVLLGLLLYGPVLPVSGLFVVLFLYGIANTGVAISYALTPEINASRVTGTALAFTNMASILVGALCQPLVGWLLDWHAGVVGTDQIPVLTAGDYHFALAVLPLTLVLALLLVPFIGETYCRRTE